MSEPCRRHDLVTTRTLALSVSSPPYCASITWRAASGPLPSASIRRTAVSLASGESSFGSGRQADTAGSVGPASVVGDGAVVVGAVDEGVVVDVAPPPLSLLLCDPLHPASVTATPPSSTPRREVRPMPPV